MAGLASRAAPRQRWRLGGSDAGDRLLIEEQPIAMVHDSTTTAVMMATPADLEDFGLGFSLTEGIIEHLDEIHDFDLVDTPLGVEVRMWLTSPRSAALAKRRRRLAGPTGCGLCGVESLAEAVRPPPKAPAGGKISAEAIRQALADLASGQVLGSATRAAHAAGWWTPDEGLALVREDVGRHNALDKLAGALARRGARTHEGAIFLTSRVSVEMVQKSAMIGAPIIVAVSAPTTLAVRVAEEAGLTLAAIARDDGFEVFTRPDRID
jgi:FdhD protein